MKLTYLITAIILLISSALYGQAALIKGRVSDQADHTPIVGANVLLVNAADSTQRKTVLSDDNGGFVFSNINNGKYRLAINYLGYRKLSMNIRAESKETDLGTLNMVADSNALGTVEVQGHIPPMVQHGDTVQYNADAYRTNPDAELEDLLDKLPGISIDNGTIKAQGEEITQILLDGKPYFGGDLNTALKNIPAETIDKVKVYYKQSDQTKFTGVDDGQSIKIIDIITKKDKRDGQFGKAHAGYGSGSHYVADGNLNFFNGNRRITLVGASSNSASGAQGGVNTSSNAGVNYSDSIGKKAYITGSYAFANSANNVQSTLTRTYFGTRTVYNEMDASGNGNIAHRINLKFESDFDTLNTLVFTPSVNIYSSRSSSGMNAGTRVNDTLQSQTRNANMGTALGYNASANLLYGHKFFKKGRTITFNGGFNISNNIGNGALQAITDFYSPHDSTTAFNQHNNVLTTNYSIAPSLNYTEPLDKNSLIQFSASTAISSSQSNKKTFDYDSSREQYNSLDTALSNYFTTNTVSSKAGVTYRLNNKKYTLNAALNYNNTILDGLQNYPYTFIIHKNFTSFLPSVLFNYKFSTRSNLNINYTTSAQSPSIFQLQDIVNNINPLQISTGNPKLQQQYAQSIRSRFGFPFLGDNSIFFDLGGSVTDHLIANTTETATKDSALQNGYIMRKGALLSMPVNLEGSYNILSDITLSIPFQKINTNLNLYLGSGWSNVPTLFNYKPGFVNTFNINTNIGLSSNFKDHLDYSLNYSPAYNIVKNTLQPLQNNNYYYHSIRFRLNWIIIKGFVLNTDLNYHNYIGLASAYNQDYISWNASIGKKFFKKQNGELRLYVYDLLDQNSNVSRTVTDTYIQDRQANRLGRYFMVSFVYQLKNYQAAK